MIFQSSPYAFSLSCSSSPFSLHISTQHIHSLPPLLRSFHLFIMMMGTKARFREKCQFNFKGKWENCCLWCCFLFLSHSHPPFNLTISSVFSSTLSFVVAIAIYSFSQSLSLSLCESSVYAFRLCSQPFSHSLWGCCWWKWDELHAQWASPGERRRRREEKVSNNDDDVVEAASSTIQFHVALSLYYQHWFRVEKKMV